MKNSCNDKQSEQCKRQRNNVGVALLAWPLLLSTACLDPLVDDVVSTDGLIFPAGSQLGDTQDDPAFDLQIADADGVGERVPLLQGFVGGQAVRYWDFGESPQFGAPLIVLARKNSEGKLEPIPSHFAIIDVVPGDPGYSPFWNLLMVEVSDEYRDEVIPSFAGIRLAQDMGLLKATVATDIVINCPSVSKKVQIFIDDDLNTLGPSGGFYKGGFTHYFDFGTFDEAYDRLPIANMYQLEKIGEPPLSEAVRGVDMTGDGDLNDTNNIFSEPANSSTYSPLTRIVKAVVKGDTTSIDRAPAELTSLTDLLNPTPTEKIIAIEETEIVRNLPQQGAP